MATCADCVHVEVCCSYLSTAYKKCKLASPDFKLLKNIECDGCQHFKDRSRFVELPCKVGDTIYEIVERRKSGEWINKIIPRKVNQIKVWQNGIGFRCGTTIWIYNNSAFFTREEAEQALKERESNA